MMMEDDEYDEYDDFDDEEDRDFEPLLSDSSEKPSLKTNRTSFEIASSPDVAFSPMMKWCTPVVATLAVFFLAGIFTLLGSSRAFATIASSEAMTMPLETCEQRFNMTYGALLDQVAKQQLFCGPERSSNCNCDNPVVPKMHDWDERMQTKWDSAFRQNKESVDNNGMSSSPYDVIFFGDSITEHWNGKDLGNPNKDYAGAHEVFNEYFNKENGGKVSGLALGIGGDRCPQVLYRLENGELPDTLQSGVFWVLIGTNDLGGDHCSTESIVAGNIQIVETIRSLRPNAKVVVNSILPRGDPGTDLFTGKSSWPTVATINRWLECYANENHNVEFFNGTSTFLQPTPNETTTVKEYYSDAVHPSRTGHAVWAAAIVERVLELVGH